MKIALGSDHAGFGLKGIIADLLVEFGHEVCDKGPDSRDSVDYPDFALMTCRAVADGECDLGILVCGTGQGMAMSANKVVGIRAAACSDTFSARLAREHNDANVLCLGERVVGPGVARDVVTSYLSAKFLGGRHTARVEKIRRLEATGGKTT